MRWHKPSWMNVRRAIKARPKLIPITTAITIAGPESPETRLAANVRERAVAIRTIVAAAIQKKAP